ncbi:EamA family transporter [Adlercreutzia aquisgranensis]|uniref:EamA family transporter n=1 Tax=Adlercreutzia aquisgranensis TaxID=2941323 RepID=UPI00203BBA46|nr:DMT family transporter [Adlercreutzia aquisgranensis]
MKSRKMFWAGFAMALVGAALWGVSGAGAQFLFDGYGASPAFVTAFRMVVAGALFLIVIGVRYRAALRRLLGCRRDWLFLALFGLGLFGSQLTFACSVAATNAGTACVLQMLNAVFVLAFVCMAGRALPTLREGLGLLLALGATVVIATQGDLGVIRLPAAGLFWGLLNALSVAVYILVPRYSGLFDRYGSFTVTGLGMSLDAIAAVAVLLAGGAAAAVGAGTAGAASTGDAALAGAPLVSAIPFDGAAWAVLIAAVALLGTFAAFALYIGGVAKVGSVTGSLLGVMEPASATALSALLLGTAFSGADWVGFALMSAMLVCMTLPGRRQGVTGSS